MNFQNPPIIVKLGTGKENYCATSIVNITHKAAEKESNTKNVYPHIVQYSIATYMIELGTGVTFVKEFPVHADIKNTMHLL